jgi:hypothetical protein
MKVEEINYCRDKEHICMIVFISNFRKKTAVISKRYVQFLALDILVFFNTHTEHRHNIYT